MAYAGGGIHIDFKEELDEREFDNFEEQHGDEIEIMLDKALGKAKETLAAELRAAGLGDKFNITTEV